MIYIFVTLHTTIKEKNIYILIIIRIIIIITSQKNKNEGDREDANRPHGHLVKQSPNVRQIKKKKHNYIL